MNDIREVYDQYSILESFIEERWRLLTAESRSFVRFCIEGNYIEITYDSWCGGSNIDYDRIPILFFEIEDGAEAQKRWSKYLNKESS